ncbi:MAG: anthranilate synthase component I family protein [Elusimicrobiota bacterium]|nr:anthranilate synthase component I family protein [Elusimicrobiota bacterium]
MKNKKIYLEPVSKKISTDFITPVSAYSLFKDDRYSLLLESAQKGRTGRYSILGFAPRTVYEIEENQVICKERTSSGYRESEKVKTSRPMDYIGKIISSCTIKDGAGINGFSGGLVGYAGYEMIGEWEDIKFNNPSLAGIPEGVFLFTDEFIVFDHLFNTARVIKLIERKENRTAAAERIDKIIEKLNGAKMPVNSVPEDPGENISYSSNFSRDEFIQSVKKIKRHIREGDIIQGVLSQRFSAEVAVDPFNYYRALRMINPSPYMFYLKLGGIKLCGSSPEVMAKLTGRTGHGTSCGCRAIVRPIAGTRPRPQLKDIDEEKKLSLDLKEDKKEQAEHTMLVDLARNDLSRVCAAGTVKTLNLMSVEKFSHVMHMVTDVEGQLKEGKTGIDLFKAAFPAGTVSGAPKLRAMEIIEEAEPDRRGPYAGALGYFSFDGNMDTAIVIRTMLISSGKVYIQAGAGIVADSVPEKEYSETVSKAEALFEAVKMGNRI